MALNLAGMIFAVASFALSSACAAQQVPDQTVWLRYWPAVVQLTGELRVVQHYGPPNYGENPETDSKLQVPILQLSHPINIWADSTAQNNNESFKGLTQIQLILGPRSEDYREFVNQKVVVTGTLSEAVWGHHFTKVVMDVKTMGYLRGRLSERRS